MEDTSGFEAPKESFLKFLNIFSVVNLFRIIIQTLS